MKIPEFILSEPLAVHGPSLAGWLQRHERREERLQTAGNMAGLSLSDFVNVRQPYQVTSAGIAMIHANEVLSRTALGIDLLFGDTHYNQLIGELGMAVNDSAVRGIFLEISSPGGGVIGASEAAAATAAASQVKPVVAYIEVVGASAAYYFAAAAHAILASPSAIVGSIGAIAMYQNIAGFLAQIGVGVEILTAPETDLKASGNRVRPMTDVEREFLQGSIEAANADFRAWVQQHRTAVPDGALRGQWFSGKEAVANGLADATGTRADALAALSALIGDAPQTTFDTSR